MKTLPLVLLFLASALPSSAAPAAEEWVARVRRDHPRLFFNADTWPAVRERALTVHKEHLDKVRQHADSPPSRGQWSVIQRPAPRPGTTTEARDWGDRLMSGAFVYRMAPDPERLRRIREMLWASLDYYHACFAANKAVDWYSRSRVSWLAALDWVWNDLAPEERRELGLSMIRHVDEALHKPNIQRRNTGGYTTGYYGDPNLAWYAGLLFLNEGFDDARALAFLTKGYDDHQKLLAHRALSAGDDGGAASPTLGYSFDAYPWAEWNFLYTWRSATGEDLSGKWPYIGAFSNYVLWNRLPGDREFGYGDTPHVDNRLPRWWLYTHLSHIMHLYAQSRPDLASLAAYVRAKVPAHLQDTYWSLYPFLMTNLEEAPPPRAPGDLPPARYFEQMGQVFMRSGDGEDDTYALFACGGISGQHRHYDATHFILYKKGFLALDTGTREGNTDNLQNYFAQTIAHNCVLIKMPGEPPSPYWNGKVFAQAGGQNKQTGSKVIAFETGPDFTYVAGDATPVYSEAKCTQMARQFLFVPPDHLVVFDRETATRPEYGKTWLLHHANEPVVEGKTWRSDQGEGRLFCRTLLPADAVLEKVGGPGKEFLVEGANYALDAGPSEEIRKNEYQIGKSQRKGVPELMGRWRMEVRPGSARTEDLYLHLLQVGDQTLEKMGEARATVSEGTAEVVFAAGEREVRLRFATTGDVAGHIRISREGKPPVDRDLARDVMPQKGVR